MDVTVLWRMAWVGDSGCLRMFVVAEWIGLLGFVGGSKVLCVVAGVVWW